MTFSITTLCYNAECLYADCRILLIVMVNVVMLRVAMLNVVILSVLALSASAKVSVHFCSKIVVGRIKKKNRTLLSTKCLLDSFWSLALMQND
jgi:hypothetical protein